MRSISEKKLKDLYRKNHSKIETSFMKEFFYGKCAALSDAICECKELQEPWMTLEEFLESGFEGWCWIVEITREPATLSYFDSDGVFSGTSGLIVFNEEFITHVMPIHKPEPPR